MSENLDDIAAEFVLGTLPPDERRVFAARLEGDAGARRAVRAWEARLAPLLGSAPEVEPSPGLLAQIESRIDAAAAAPQLAPARRVDWGRLAFWRGLAIGSMGLAAASLAWAFVGGRIAPPDAPGLRYVAVVDSGGREPALIAEVDTGTGLIRVRSIAAQVPEGRSLELWHVAEGHPPRSLGVLNASLQPQSIQGEPSAEPVDGQIAVTVEPTGGSPSGAPTGPVVYSGRLVPMDE